MKILKIVAILSLLGLSGFASAQQAPIIWIHDYTGGQYGIFASNSNFSAVVGVSASPGNVMGGSAGMTTSYFKNACGTTNPCLLSLYLGDPQTGPMPPLLGTFIVDTQKMVIVGNLTQIQVPQGYDLGNDQMNIYFDNQ